MPGTSARFGSLQAVLCTRNPCFFDSSFLYGLTSFARHSKKLGCGYTLMKWMVAVTAASKVDFRYLRKKDSSRAGKSCGRSRFLGSTEGLKIALIFHLRQSDVASFKLSGNLLKVSAIRTSDLDC